MDFDKVFKVLLTVFLVPSVGYIAKTVTDTARDVAVVRYQQETHSTVLNDIEQRMRPLERQGADHEQRLKSLEADKARRP